MLFLKKVDVLSTHSNVLLLNRRLALVGGDFGDPIVPPPHHGQCCQPLDQAAQSPIQRLGHPQPLRAKLTQVPSIKIN